jgi:hypothetical protein
VAGVRSSNTVSASEPYRVSSHSVAGMSAGSTVSETVNRFAWAMLLGETSSVRPWSAGACASAVPALGARCPA